MKEYLEDIKNAVQVLKNKGTILYPTDTIWGLGCDATNAEAVQKIYQIKKRPAEKNFILLVDSESMLMSYVKNIPEQAWNLMEFSEKPITIIYDEARNLPAETTADDGSIAVRVTRDEFCKKLIGAFRKPLISTSANITGKQFPSRFREIENSIVENVDYVVKWRQEETTKINPSSIIRLRQNGQITFIRR
jgi:L-threonylcarbamoyladenylate synthase